MGLAEFFFYLFVAAMQALANTMAELNAVETELENLQEICILEPDPPPVWVPGCPLEQQPDGTVIDSCSGCVVRFGPDGVAILDCDA